MPRARTLLLEAYDRIKDPERWNGTGNYQRGKRCTVEALFDACVERSVHRDIKGTNARRAIQKAIRMTAHVPKGCIHRNGKIDIINWNDAPETTHDDVLAVFRRAIKSVSFPWEKVPA